MIWMLFDYLKQATNRHSYTDYEDLASVKLHGMRLGNFWQSWKFVLRNITFQPAKDVLEYLVWTQVKDCDLIKDECAIYSRKTKKDPAKKSYSALQTIIESYLEGTTRQQPSSTQGLHNRAWRGWCRSARNASRWKR